MKISRLLLVLLNLLAVWLIAPRAQGAVLDATLTTLTTFNNTNGGANPFAPPVLGPDGALYGTTAYADTAKGTNLAGVIYEITTNGENITLHTFDQMNGEGVSAPLIFGRDGNLYGVATAGGTNGMGTLFRFNTNGTFEVLYSFGRVRNNHGVALDGATPYGGLVQGQDGFLYGTTYGGGASNVGTIFQFSTNNNTLNTLWSFSGTLDGAHPEETPLVEGPAGVFYGTTYLGGISNCGTIFEVTSGGAFRSVIQFTGPDGQGAFNGLSFGANGDLFGTTVQGGANGDGTVFRLDAFGTRTTLFQFSKTDGMAPQSGITVGPDNVLFGTTDKGGAKGFGTVFQLLTNGQLTTLYSFTNKNDGANPASGVILDDSGNLYGTTEAGGTNNGRGTVYRLQFAFLPTVTFTSPRANQRWSNDVFTVRGTVTTNFNVTNVVYSVNGGTWTNATTSNNWTNWTGQVTLIPGTNTIAAYALDAAGNTSPTNTVKLDYVVTFPIIVLTKGEGSVSPNYNNASLNIGTTYSMTAKAAKGSKFTRWTDGNTNSISVFPKLSFVMTNDLTFIAFFADTNLPNLAITSPKSGAKFSNDMVVVTGTASDNLAVSNVQYSFNFGAFSNATTLNHWTNWSITLALSPGTNFLTVIGFDTSGNERAVNTLRLDYVPSDTLAVNIVGSGTLKPDYNGALLALGNNYTMKATPARGFGFYFWNGGVPMSSNPTLTFTMTNDLVINANFRDITPPAISITSPKANAKFSNAVNVITVSGKATDNVGLTNVGVRINNGTWQTAPATGTSFSWSIDASPVKRGTNFVDAYAMDIDGNLATNTVKFIGILPPDWAPDSLANSTLEVTPASGDPITATFGSTNFSQTDILTTNDSGTGLYTYSQTATNAAELELNFVSPPSQTNNNPQDIVLNFTDLNAGTFTNVTSADFGTFDIVPTATLVPTSWSGHTVSTTNNDNNTKTTLQFKSKTSVTLTINGSPNTDTYKVTEASPVGALVVVTDPGVGGEVHYLQLTFTAKNAGYFEVDNYDGSTGEPVDSDFGRFGFK
jgi:uncharacterized repeat protein (TIGR03803 family)